MNTATSTTSTSPRHAILVEDDAFMATVLGDLLRDAGVTRVSTASDGNAGLAILDGDAARSADLVVCDLHMPRCDGFEFMDQLAQRQFGGRVLLVSGMSDRTRNSAQLMGQFHGLRIVGVLPKPVTRSALAAALRP